MTIGQQHMAYVPGKVIELRVKHLLTTPRLNQQELHSPLKRRVKHYIACISEALKRIGKSSSYYRCILLLHKPKGRITYKAKMEKKVEVTLQQSYVNNIMAMLNLRMIPPGNSNIIHRNLLRKTKPGSEIKTWKNQSWDGYCNQCYKEIEIPAHIFECEKTIAYLDALSLNKGVQGIYGIKSLLGDHYLWHAHKKRSQILAQFPAASFIIAEIMRCRLHGDMLYWRRTKFKLVAYIFTNLLIYFVLIMIGVIF